MASIAISGKSTSSVKLYLASLDTSWASGERDVFWYLGSPNGGIPTESAYYKTKVSYLDDGVSEGAEVKFTGLEANTQYGVYCTVYHESTLLAELQGYATTDEASIWTIYPHDITEITHSDSWLIDLQEYEVHRFSVVFADSGYVRFFTQNTVDTIGYLSDNTEINDEGSGPEYPIASDDDNGEGLNFKMEYYVTAGVEYQVYVRGCCGTEIGEVIFRISAPISEKIEKWNWGASNGSAPADVTYVAYDAVTSRTAVENFSHLVWNDLVDKVKKITDVSSDFYWDETYASYADTLMSLESYELTAVMFNSLRNNVDFGCYTGIDKVYTGYDVLGSYFTTLAECINVWIDNL